MEKKKIVYLGTPKISANLLEKMINYGFNIVTVITQEDKLQGRKRELTPSEVAKIASKYNIPCYKPHKLNKDFQFLKEIEPDLLLTFAYGQIISEEVLHLSKYKPLNLHASILPKYRGASPIQASLAYGDEVTGVSLMEMVKKMDAGDIYYQKMIKISADDNYSTLSDKLVDVAFDIVKDHLDEYFENKLVGKKQDENQASYVHLIKSEDEHLKINQSGKDFVNQIRSLANVPGGYLIYDNQKIKIYEAKVYSYEIKGEIGQVIEANKNVVLIQLKDSLVSLLKLQKPGKNIINNKEFYNGNQNFKGKILL